MEEKNRSIRKQRAELAQRKAETRVINQEIVQVGVNPNGKTKYRQVTTLSNGNKYSSPCAKPERVAI
jgi:hypothetical protein